MLRSPPARLAPWLAWGSRFPWGIVATAGLLALIGLAAIGRSQELAGRGDWVRQQQLWLALAPLALFSAAAVPLRVWSAASYPLYAASLIGLSIVYAFPAVHGSHRWIRVFGWSVQPSEFAKLALILALSRWLATHAPVRTLCGWSVPLVMTFVPVWLILREPDLGTALVLLPMVVLLVVVSGARWRDVGWVALCGLVMMPILWTGMNREQRSRVTALWNQTVPGETPRADDYQLHQAKQLLALGGIGGSWLSSETVEDRQVYHLPESHCDFIFTVVAERWGWWGVASVLGLHATLFGSLLSIAAATRVPFARLVAAGIGGMIAVQALINASMTVGLVPITGVCLPLVSYGGSSLLATSVGLGIAARAGLARGFQVGHEPFSRPRAPWQPDVTWFPG